jgi:mono/diheme cytochrome c family protein
MRLFPALASALAVAGSLAACGDEETVSPTNTSTSSSAGSSSSSGGGPTLAGDPIPADPQRSGDATKGYAALVNEGYVSCGIPYTAYAQVFSPAPANLRLPGRSAVNTPLPYSQTRFTTGSGVDVVSANCLTCHAGFLQGKLVVGLGDTQGDFTNNNQGSLADTAQFLLTNPKEKAELTRFAGRLKAIGPYTQTLTVGVNPADNLAAVLFAHRDPKTLAWSDAPLLALPPKVVIPVDVPPWWRMAKKTAMFYVAGGRGDHARIEMTASTLCTDTVEEAKKIDAYFPDIEAFIASIAPPKYPFSVDPGLAAKGKDVFAATCARCHGTYGDGGKYPNLLIALETIGTDAAMITGATQFADTYVKWFNDSFYGQIAHLDPQHGYVAPPLDGVWATAPYLHNGSVPTIAALLDSSKRPAYWSRKYDASGTYDSNDYNEATLGWNVTALDHGQSTEADAAVKKHIYDTSLPGYSNVGHTFGDGLSGADRSAVIEYLKTL